MFQVTEDDLEVMERELPNLLSAAQSAPHWNESPHTQEAWQMIQKIISNIRWNYGPPTRIETLE